MGFFDSAADKLKIASLEKEINRLNDVILSLQQDRKNLEHQITETEKEKEKEITELRRQLNEQVRDEYKHKAPQQSTTVQTNYNYTSQQYKTETIKQISQMAAASAINNAANKFTCKPDPYYRYGLCIVSYNGFDPTRIAVPETIDRRDVVSIADDAFRNSPASEIVLPSTVKKIGHYSFSGCKNLKRILLPDGLTEIGINCFEKSGLESIVFPDNIKRIGIECCKDCKDLKSVTLGKRLELIGKHAFLRCSNLKSIKLPDGLKNIDDQAFFNTGITDIVIPASADKIGSSILCQTNTSSDDRMDSYVFLGTDTKIDGLLHSDKESHRYKFDIDEALQGKCNGGIVRFGAVIPVIYCLPGSEAQRYAQRYNIKCRPLSEYRQ